MATDYHALVIGASGLIGWGVVDQLLKPSLSPSPFAKVIALVNRPLKVEDALWPESTPKLDLLTGINLLCDDDEFESILRDKLPDAGSISHVYYCGTIPCVGSVGKN